jgi:hypothetical protein
LICRPEREMNSDPFEGIAFVKSKTRERCSEYLICPMCANIFKYEWNRPIKTLVVPAQLRCIRRTCGYRGPIHNWEVADEDAILRAS